MICPKCKELGKTSTIQILDGFVTSAMSTSYYDEVGRYHYHDVNNHVQNYLCSNGHSISVSFKTKCNSCDYNAGLDTVKVTVKDLGPQTVVTDGVDLVGGTLNFLTVDNFANSGSDD